MEKFKHSPDFLKKVKHYFENNKNNSARNIAEHFKVKTEIIYSSLRKIYPIKKNV